MDNTRKFKERYLAGEIAFEATRRARSPSIWG